MLPEKPAGEPEDIDAELLRRQAVGWVYSGGRVTMPQADSRLVLADRARWRGWARALEGSVAWAGTASR